MAGEKIVRNDWDNGHKIWVCSICEQKDKIVKLNSPYNLRQHYKSKHQKK